MNLNIYDDVNYLDRTKTWYNPNSYQIYSRNIKYYPVYSIKKRFNKQINKNEYYLCLCNDNIDNSFNSTRRSNKGVLSFKVKRIINDCNLKYIKEPTNINYEVIEEDNDGIVYLLDI